MPSTAPISYRPAALADADQLGQLHVATWQSAYAGLLPAAFLAGLEVADRSARWREILASAGPASTTVAVVDDRLIGFVSTGLPLADARSDTGWLYALYVDASWWGTGVGRQLHDLGLEALRALGYRRAELWVLRSNARAIGFYRRQGWSEDGREQLDQHLPGVELDEIGMTRPLA